MPAARTQLLRQWIAIFLACCLAPHARANKPDPLSKPKHSTHGGNVTSCLSHMANDVATAQCQSWCDKVRRVHFITVDRGALTIHRCDAGKAL